MGILTFLDALVSEGREEEVICGRDICVVYELDAYIRGKRTCNAECEVIQALFH